MSLLNNRVVTTDINMGSDENFRNFIRVYGNAFPRKVEREYVILTNLVADYIVLCNSMKKETRKAEENLGSINHLEDVESEVSSLSTDLDTLYREFKGSMTSKKSNDLMRLAKQLTVALKKKEFLDVKYAHKQEKRMAAEIETDRLRTELETAVDQMALQLKSIYALNVDGKRRLDNLTFDMRHVDELKTIQVPDVSQEVLVNVLAVYFDLRKTLFGIVEDFASKATVAYHNREVLETGEDTDIYHVVNCLESMTIEDAHISSFMNSAYMEFLNNGSVLMKKVTQYFKTGSFDLEEDRVVEDWLSSVQVDYNVKTSYRTLANMIRQRIMSEHKSGETL